MKRILLGLTAGALFCGCANTAKIVKAVGESNASVRVRFTTLYGTLQVERTNPGTNSLPHSVKDGEITVTK